MPSSAATATNVAIKLHFGLFFIFASALALLFLFGGMGFIISVEFRA
jgi:hypothetical protein